MNLHGPGKKRDLPPARALRVSKYPGESLPHLRVRTRDSPVNRWIFPPKNVPRGAIGRDWSVTDPGFVRSFVRRARPHRGSDTVTCTRTVFSFIRTHRHETTRRRDDDAGRWIDPNIREFIHRIFASSSQQKGRNFEGTDRERIPRGDTRTRFARRRRRRGTHVREVIFTIRLRRAR